MALWRFQGYALFSATPLTRSIFLFWGGDRCRGRTIHMNILTRFEWILNPMRYTSNIISDFIKWSRIVKNLYLIKWPVAELATYNIYQIN